MIQKAIERAFKKAKERNWDKLYFAVDVHDTIVEANYDKGTLPTKFYPQAKEVLQYISTRGDIVLILYTCSHPEELVKYLDFFKQNEINFQYANENPLIQTTSVGLGNYEKKMYFDVLFEDKAGFDPEEDWELTIDTLNFLPLLNLEERFQDLLKKWQEETKFHSSVHKIIENEHFVKLMELGEGIIELMFKEIEKEPSTLVWGLNLAFQRKVSEEGDSITEACKKWVEFGKQNGYL